jgi:hypothetical protein
MHTDTHTLSLSFSLSPAGAGGAGAATQMGPGLATPLLDATLLLLQRFMSEPMFTALRTQEQLGYIVAVSKDSYGE